MSTKLKATVLVGNGFDLAAGLKTSAMDLMERLVGENRDEDGLFADTPAGRLAGVVSSEGVGNWGDFELKFGEYAAHVASSAKDGEECAREYLGAKGALDRILQEWIVREDGRVSDEFVAANAEKCIDSLLGWPLALRPAERAKLRETYSSPVSCQYDFVTFNYTSVLERMLEAASGRFRAGGSNNNGIVSSHSMGKVVHVHGDLGGIPVCGVDNATQIADECLCFDPRIARTVVKDGIQRLYAEQVDLNAKKMIRQSDLIIIYGMSISRTDARWWKEVVTWLAKNSKHFLVMCTRKVGSVLRIPTEYADFVSSYKARLFDSAELGNGRDDFDAEGFYGQMFIVDSRSLFVMESPLGSEDLVASSGVVS